MWRLLKCLGLVQAVLVAGSAAGYRAGVVRLEIPEEAQAVAIEDPSGGRIVVVTTGRIGLPRAIIDWVAARTGLDRSQVLFDSGPVPSPDPVGLAGDLVTLIAAALGDLKPAVLSYAGGSHLRVAAPDGSPLAVLFQHAGSMGSPRRLRGPIRSAFRMVEPKFLLRTREASAPSSSPCSVQAVRFGKNLTLLALGAELRVPYARRIERQFSSAKEPVVLVGNSNGASGPLAEDLEDAVFDGIRNVMKRVGK